MVTKLVTNLVTKSGHLQTMDDVGLDEPDSHVRMALLPALGFSGSTLMVTVSGLKRTERVVVAVLGSSVAAFLASQRYATPLSDLKLSFVQIPLDQSPFLVEFVQNVVTCLR